MSETVLVAGDAGDLAAPPGSRAWALAVRAELQAAVRDTRFAARLAADYRSGMDQHAGYRQLIDGHGRAFQSFAQFCHAPLPHGLGISLPELDTLIAQRLSAQEHAVLAEPLAKHGSIGRGRNNRGDNITSNSRGTRASYLAARIARDRPDILERMQFGEFKSVRQAAIEAGIVRVAPREGDVLNADEVKITLRLPSGMHRQLVDKAEVDRRSLNSQIVFLLDLALHPEKEAKS